ncbi:hypothetical protein [Streptomyces sp. NPDC059247]|uniref:hypothetical protein n=1 Tax=Streptomyces sp. NPDC059247 TaxID=3346790 RepID=UPI0036BE5099
MAKGLPQNSSAVVVWENTWAARLAEAVSDSNGRLVMLERIPRDTVEQAVSALQDS